MPPAVDSPAHWREWVREPSLTALLACLLLLTFVVTPLVELGVIGQLAAGVIWSLLGVLAVLVVSGHRAAVAVILAAMAAGLATAIFDRPSALSAVLGAGLGGHGLGGAGRGHRPRGVRARGAGDVAPRPGCRRALPPSWRSCSRTSTGC